jgi:hypothetical protein
MNDASLNLMRVVTAAFVPVMLLFPLVFVLCVPKRVEGFEERRQANQRQWALAILTLVAVGVWAGLALTAHESQSEWLERFVRFTWILFFPLWFGLAMPAIRAKNSVWGSGLSCDAQNTSPVRTASLAPRTRENPITPLHWAFAATLFAILLVAMAARSLYPFAEGFNSRGGNERLRWQIVMGVYAFCGLFTFTLMPRAIWKMHTAPEPLDPSGSPELIELYKMDRLRRVRSLFWLLVVVQPVFLGLIFCASLWISLGSGRTLGMIGGIGGSLLGFLGASVGIASAYRRIRIAQVKAKLESGEATG